MLVVQPAITIRDMFQTALNSNKNWEEALLTFEKKATGHLPLKYYPYYWESRHTDNAAKNILDFLGNLENVNFENYDDIILCIKTWKNYYVGLGIQVSLSTLNFDPLNGEDIEFRSNLTEDFIALFGGGSKEDLFELQGFIEFATKMWAKKLGITPKSEIWNVNTECGHTSSYGIGKINKNFIYDPFYAPIELEFGNGEGSHPTKIILNYRHINNY